LLDLSANSANRYSWVRSVSLADVSAERELRSFGEVTSVSSHSGDALSAGGSTHRFSNMASYGLHIGTGAAARTEVGAIGGTESGGQGVLVLYSNADRASTNRVSGASASHDVSPSTSSPTLATDKPDYLPGDTVLFTGAAWAPSDT